MAGTQAMSPPVRPQADDLRAALAPAVADALHVAADHLRWEPIGAVVPRADAPTALRVADAAGRRLAVLLCSAPGHVDMIERAMHRAAQARAMLPVDDAEAILQPLLAGRWQGLSYAVLPHCEPLARLRPQWWVQRALLRPRVFDWLHRLTAATMAEVTPLELEARYTEPLRRLELTPELAAPVRREAARAAARLRDSSWKPMHVLMHGDLWKGNILVRPHRSAAIGMTLAPRFVVIDWPGSLQQGYAMFDLVRLSMSLRVQRRSFQAELQRHCKTLGYSADDAMASLMAALGYIAIHLEEFPLTKFIAMAQACHGALADAAGK